MVVVAEYLVKYLCGAAGKLRLTSFLEEVVACTCDTRQRLSLNCEEVNHLLCNWVLPQSSNLDVVVGPECSHLNNGIKEAQKVTKICSSSQKPKNKTSNTVSGNSVYHKSLQEERTDKIHSHSKQFTSLAGKFKMTQKGIQDKAAAVAVNALPSTESKDPLKKKILIKFRQNPLVPRTTYQNDYSTLKTVTHSKHEQNTNNINLTARISQAKKKFTDSLTNVKSERTRKSLNGANGNKQIENGKVRRMCTVDNKHENNKLKEKYLTLEEAIDTFNIYTTSSELIRNFRLHYSFLDNMEEKRDHPAAAQDAAAKRAFLKLFSELNKESWHKNLSEPIGRLFADIMTLSKEVFYAHNCVSRRDSQEELELKNMYQRMEKQFLRLSNQDNIVHTVERSRSAPQNAKYTTSCQNIGMWYSRQSAIYNGVHRKLYLIYKDEKQWQQLQKNVQLIEKLKFQIDMFELLLSEVIPQILVLDRNTKNFQMMLKVIWAMTDFRRLPIPIFIIP